MKYTGLNELQGYLHIQTKCNHVIIKKVIPVRNGKINAYHGYNTYVLLNLEKRNCVEAVSKVQLVFVPLLLECRLEVANNEY